MLVDHIISGTCNSRIREVIFIGGSTTLSDYKNQLMRSLHTVDSRSSTQASSHCYLHRVLEFN